MASRAAGRRGQDARDLAATARYIFLLLKHKSLDQFDSEGRRMRVNGLDGAWKQAVRAE